MTVVCYMLSIKRTCTCLGVIDLVNYIGTCQGDISCGDGTKVSD